MESWESWESLEPRESRGFADVFLALVISLMPPRNLRLPRELNELALVRIAGVSTQPPGTHRVLGGVFASQRCVLLVGFFGSGFSAVGFLLWVDAGPIGSMGDAPLDCMVCEVPSGIAASRL